VRTLTPELIGGPVDLTVADLSFISLRLVLPALVAATATGGDLVLLVKPQFEAGRQAVGKGGVVRDPAAWAGAVRAVAAAAASHGLGVRGLCPSPLPGPAGNVEFFLHLRAGSGPLHEDALAAAIDEAAALPRRGSGGLKSEATAPGRRATPSGSPPVNRGSGGLESEALATAPGRRAEPSGSPPVDRVARGAG
jgi:23S rRNA (cytidine1920-2'-O)/16S rRNA (cytidine1409-2'-O)-methyltransferase